MKEYDREDNELHTEIIKLVKLPDFNDPAANLRLEKAIDQLDKFIYEDYSRAIKLVNILLLCLYENKNTINSTLKLYKNLFTFYEERENQEISPNEWKIIKQHAFSISQTAFFIGNYNLALEHKDFIINVIHSSEILFQYVMHHYRPEPFDAVEILSMVNFIKIFQEKLLRLVLSLEIEEKIAWPKKNFNNLSINYISLPLNILIQNNIKKREIIDIRLKAANHEENHLLKIEEIERLIKIGDEERIKHQCTCAHQSYSEADKISETIDINKYKILTSGKLATNATMFVENRCIETKLGKTLKNNQVQYHEYNNFMIEQLKVILKYSKIFADLSTKEPYYIDNIFDEKIKFNNQYIQYASFINFNIVTKFYVDYINHSTLSLGDKKSILAVLIELNNTNFIICQDLMKDEAKSLNLIKDKELLNDVKEKLNHFMGNYKSVLEYYQDQLDKVHRDIEEINIRKELKEKEFQQKLESSEQVFTQLMQECQVNERKATKRFVNKIIKKDESKAYTKPRPTESVSHTKKITKSKAPSEVAELSEKALKLMVKKDYKGAEILYRKLLKEAENTDTYDKIPKYLSAIADCFMYYVLTDLKKLHVLEYNQFSLISRNLRISVDYHERAIDYIIHHLNKAELEKLLYPVNLALDFINSLNQDFANFLEHRNNLLIIGKEKAKREIIEKFGKEAWYHNDPDKPKSIYTQELESGTQRLIEVIDCINKIQNIKDKNFSLLTKDSTQNIPTHKEDKSHFEQLTKNIEASTEKNSINRVRSHTLPIRNNALSLAFTDREFLCQSTINPRIAVIAKGL